MTWQRYYRMRLSMIEIDADAKTQNVCGIDEVSLHPLLLSTTAFVAVGGASGREFLAARDCVICGSCRYRACALISHQTHAQSLRQDWLSDAAHRGVGKLGELMLERLDGAVELVNGPAHRRTSYSTRFGRQPGSVEIGYRRLPETRRYRWRKRHHTGFTPVVVAVAPTSEGLSKFISFLPARVPCVWRNISPYFLSDLDV